MGKARVVRTIDERIEILTGVKAGARRSDGTFADGTVNYRGDKRLREIAEKPRILMILHGRGKEKRKLALLMREPRRIWNITKKLRRT